MTPVFMPLTSHWNKLYEGNVFMYYGLLNFYQNYSHYVKSQDDSQLNGDSSALLNPSKKCEPY